MRVSRRTRRLRQRRIQTAAAGVAAITLCVFILTAVLKSNKPPETIPASNLFIENIEVKPPSAVIRLSFPTPSAETLESEITIAVYDHKNAVTTIMPLDEYVYHCLCAEMPAKYEVEALKAQAVAIRTYAASKLAMYGGSGCNRSSSADVCTDSAHCQAFAADEYLMERWGDEYAANSGRMKAAVEDTSGMVITFGGKPILAMFHANSGGLTEDVEAVYSNALPYLRSVESFDPDSVSVITLTKSEAAKIINAQYPKANVKAADLEEQLIVKSRLASGRIESLICGRITLTGTELRKLFSLPSSIAYIKYSQNEIEFTSYGRGHGVGMSQEGAQEMAKSGYSFSEILSHFYQSTEIRALGNGG